MSASFAEFDLDSWLFGEAFRQIFLKFQIELIVEFSQIFKHEKKKSNNEFLVKTKYQQFFPM